MELNGASVCHRRDDCAAFGHDGLTWYRSPKAKRFPGPVPFPASSAPLFPPRPEPTGLSVGHDIVNPASVQWPVPSPPLSVVLS